MISNNSTTLACTFGPAGHTCGRRLSPAEGYVPDLKTVRERDQLKRPITAGDLAKNVICGRHAHMIRSAAAERQANSGRKIEVRFFRYLETVAEIERPLAERKADQVAAEAYLASYRSLGNAPRLTQAKSSARPVNGTVVPVPAALQVAV